jgi:hypothetical protein
MMPSLKLSSLDGREGNNEVDSYLKKEIRNWREVKVEPVQICGMGIRNKDFSLIKCY